MSVPNVDAILPDGYTTKDCHVIVFGETRWDGTWLFPTDKLIWWAINGVAQPLTRIQKETTGLAVEYNEVNEFVFSEQNTFADQLSTTPAKGDIIHAIFDWTAINDNSSLTFDWIDEVLQFGSRSVWDETQNERFKEPEGYVNPPALPSGRIPNQLKHGAFAFMTIKVIKNSKAFAELDVSNLKDISAMFYGFGTRVTLNADLSKWDVSNATYLEKMFAETTFNGDISGWNTSNVKSMRGMFEKAYDFNQDISGWNTSKVENMNDMFRQALSFNQDLSEWCVSKFASKPSSFDTGSGFQGQTAKHPQWGTCPRGEDQVDNNGGIESNDKWYLGELEAKAVYAGTTQLYPHPGLFPITIDGVTYEEEDAHIFIANGNEVRLPIPANDPDNCPAVFVAVDGVEVTPTRGETVIYPGQSYEYLLYHWSVPANENQKIHAIFDWDNSTDRQRAGGGVNQAKQDWFSDILQFGLNSETGKRNQLKSADGAFLYMEANSDTISTLDISNVTDMSDMFAYSPFNSDISKWNTSNVTRMYGMFAESSFNSDISQWDTSNVQNMNYMFYLNYDFNQDISGWDVSNVTDMGAMFYKATDFNQDLSKWCVSLIDSKPSSFDRDSGFEGQAARQPQWGTCPRGEDRP